jgi:hypothetical protein
VPPGYRNQGLATAIVGEGILRMRPQRRHKIPGKILRIPFVPEIE